MTSRLSYVSLLPRTLLLAGLLWPLGAHAWLTLPETPLFLTATGVPPNVLVTLDDSGSMQWAWMPDNQSGTTGTRRSKSSHFNPIYYNPNVIYTPPIGANGVALSTTFNNAWNNGFDTSRGSVNLNSDYRHTWTYNPSRAAYAGNDYGPIQNEQPNDFPAGQRWSGVRAYYYNFVPGNANCNGTATDEDCYTRVDVTSAADMQNFANWYSFYRTRNLATVSAASIAFGMFAPETRLAWQALNSCPSGWSGTFVTNDCDGWTNLNLSNAIKPLGPSGATPGAHRVNFYSWLHRLPAAGGTPLRTAFERSGAYLETSGAQSPWDNDLVTGGLQGEATCRKSFSIIMTDGMWNGDSNNFHSNRDGTSFTLGDGTAYTAPRPYTDSNSHSVSDIAMYYWGRDLRTDLANNVPAYMPVTTGTPTQRYWNPANDPATWQHMTTYTVGLGLTPALQSTGLTWNGNMYGGSYTNILTGPTNWPPVSDNSSNNPSDLWHAAINGRGRFYSADDPNALVQAFTEIVNSISAASAGGGAGAALNTRAITDLAGTATRYSTSYGSDWNGQLLAREFIGATGSYGTTYWDAATRIPLPAARNIFTWSGGARSMATCDSNLMSAFSAATNAICTDKLNWLRGDFTKEIRRGGPYRNRVMAVQASALMADNVTYPIDFKVNRCIRRADGTFYQNSPAYTGSLGASEVFDCPWVLGDIINSDLVYTSTPQEDYGYGQSGVTLPGHDTYAAYLTTKASRQKMIYAGANDGMLHAFNADTGGANAGKELFAYVPAGVYSKLNALTEPGYTHKFYVNGPVTVADAYIGGGWKSYLLGTLGAGGKSVYALDVSNPTSFGTSHIKWEFTDTDLGYVYGRALIAPIDVNGTITWAAIFGNGYNSGPNATSDRAYLYILNLDTGSVIAKMATNSNTANGLSTPYLYDANGDKVIDYIYAGDLRGNLWQFRTSGASWQSSSAQLLFAATNAASQAQPITVPPSVHGTHPNGGIMVYFGTGSYMTAADLANAQGQTFYGIWVQNPASPTTVTRSTLLQQTITGTPSAGGKTWRTVSTNTPNWATHKGWYLDLPLPGSGPSERVVGPSMVIDKVNSALDRVVFLTATPSGDPCVYGGTGWLMELSLLTGGQPGIAVADTNGVSGFDAGDIATGGMQLGATTGIGLSMGNLLFTGNDGTVGIHTTTDYIDIGGTKGDELVKRRGDDVTVVGGNPGRVNWQQIL